MPGLTTITLTVVCGLAAALLTTLPSHAAESVPLADIPIRDPFILADAASHTYFLYLSRDGAVQAYTSKDLKSWDGPRIVFAPPKEFWGQEAIWAPEVHTYRGRYYLFVTFTSREPTTTPLPDWKPGPALVKRGTQILAADSPRGPFKPFRNRATTPEEWMALDGTLWVEKGEPWMIFCHEWVQVQDGTMEAVRLKSDLSEPVGKPITLFRGSDAPWGSRQAEAPANQRSWVTDGPFLYRTRGGRLLMLWSSFGPGQYTVGVARSKSGTVAGPWEQLPEPVYATDGGHGMLFRAFGGRLLMALHHPNGPGSRATLVEMEDTGDSLRPKR